MDLAQEILKVWGPPGMVVLLLLEMLRRSEKREAQKDTRIQMLENLLNESYDERVSAADRIAEAIHGNATALIALVNEVRSNAARMIELVKEVRKR
jgi:hypothetical protein